MADSGSRVFAWLDSLRADAVFGWRQIRKNKIASAAAIVSLALATGAGSEFRRPLGVACVPPPGNPVNRGAYWSALSRGH